jgi:hypothetical protein
MKALAKSDFIAMIVKLEDARSIYFQGGMHAKVTKTVNQP